MKAVILMLFASVLGAWGENKDIVLKAISEKAVSGSTYTLDCSVDPSLNSTNVLWFKDGTAVFVSSIFSFNTIVDVNQTQIHNVFGRYFITVLGAFKHHMTLLINRRLDDGTSWRCAAFGSNVASNELTINAVDAETPGPCGWWCIVGSTIGVVMGLLVLDLLLCTKCFTKRM